MNQNQTVLGSDPLEWLNSKQDKQKSLQQTISAKGEDSMSATKIDSSAATLLKLPAQFTIAEVAGVHEKLLEIMRSSESLQIDAAEVQKVDGAALQLIAALFATAKKAHLNITWGVCSDQFESAVTLLGLQTELNCG